MNSSFLRKKQAHLLVGVGLLLIIFASRVLLLDQIQLEQDEARSAMRMFGTPAEIIAWQPPDWPPLHNLLLALWRLFASPLPFALQMSSVFIFLISAAALYRAAKRLFASERAAWLVVVVYAAMAYSLYLSTFVRAYVLAMALFALALWATLRYFHRPTWQRALLLAILLAAMFYSTYTAVLAFVILGLYTLFTTPRAIWSWWLPGVFAGLLAIPEFVRKFDYFFNRVSSSSSIQPNLEPFPELMVRQVTDYFGDMTIIWLLVIAVALVLLVIAPRLDRGRKLWLLTGIVLGPVGLYMLATIPIVYFFEARYVWWVFAMIALAFGYGLAHLPRALVPAVGVGLMVMMFATPIKGEQRPYAQNFRWLQEKAEPGDVMLVDPNFCVATCGEADAWGYYYDVYLRDKVEQVDAVDDQRRVWYVKADGWQVPEVESTVTRNRIPAVFVGPWDFLIRLYEGPPDPDGVLFENGLRFHGFDVLQAGDIQHPPFYWREQTTSQVRLWWSVDHPLEADYSISLQVYDPRRQRLIAQNDGPPHGVHLSPVESESIPSETSQWEPGRYYVDERNLAFANLGSESYAELMLTVYQWWDGARLNAPGVREDGLLPLTPVIVWGWG